MIYPNIKGVSQNRTISTSNFKGINRTNNYRENQFYNTQMLSFDKYPAVSPRSGIGSVNILSGYIVYAVKEPTNGNSVASSFTGIIFDNGYKFIYKGTEITGSAEIALGKPSCIINFNGKYLIYPQKLYFDYSKYAPEDADTKKLQTIEKGCFNQTNQFFFAYNSENQEYYIEFMGHASMVEIWGDAEDLKGYSVNIKTNKTKNNTHEVVRSDDYVSDEVITSAVIRRTACGTYSDPSAHSGYEYYARVYFDLYNKNAEAMKFKNDDGTDVTGMLWANGTVNILAPAIQYATVWNNRIWATDTGGEMIYASKLGDFQQFYRYDGLSTDSWYGQVATEGTFTGITTYKNSILAFKQNCIHEIMGDKPSNYSITQQYDDGGCNSHNSITECSGRLFFTSYDGVYAYTGSYPIKISDNLGDIDLTSVKPLGCCDSENYYLLCGSGLYQYNIGLGEWLKILDIDITDVGGLYRANKRVLFSYRANGVSGDSLYYLDPDAGFDNVNWLAESNRIYLSNMNKSFLNNIFFKIDMFAGSTVSLYVASDSDTFTHIKTINYADIVNTDGTRKTTVRVPVTLKVNDYFRWKVEGSGQAEIMQVDKVIYTAGKQQNNFKGDSI